MARYRLYHNPRCSKSRAALALLEQRGITPELVLYLETPPDVETLRSLVTALGLSHPAQLLRTKEDDYQAAGLSADSDAEQVLAAMAAYPRLIERPLLVQGARAVIGRPTENLLDLLE